MRSDVGRNVVRVLKFKAGETIRGFGAGEADTARAVGNNLYLVFKGDRDVVILGGITNFDDLMFASDALM